MLKFGRSLMLLAALALPVTAGHFAFTSAPAEAAGKKPRAAKVVKVAKVARVKKGKKAKAKKAGYKSCGVFMYRKGGKCMDARLKK